MRIHLELPLTGKELGETVGCPCPFPEQRITFLSTDSREVQPGDLFVALSGTQDDGNHHLAEALARGAALLLCRRALTLPAQAMPVTEPEEALAALGQRALSHISPTVVAITGSVGKTTTKEYTAAILSTRYRVHRTPGNHNNLLGVSLALLTMPRHTEVLVAELGMNHAGEIGRLSELIHPAIAAVTNAGAAHIGHLGSRTAVAHAKREILLGCMPGALYLYPAHQALLEPPPHTDVLPLPVTEDAPGACGYTNIQIRGGRTSFLLHAMHGVRHFLTVPGTGAHLAACATYAALIGLALDIPLSAIGAALATIQPPPMRQRLYDTGGITVMEDCYNASPESMHAAADSLFLLSAERGGRPVALLGDMLELGEAARPLHEEVGRYFASKGLPLLFTFGAIAENYATGARAAGMAEETIYRNPDPTAPEKSAAALARVLRQGDILLVKASRQLAAERIPQALAPLLCTRKEPPV